MSADFALTLEYGEIETELMIPSTGELAADPAACPCSGVLALKRRNLSSDGVSRLRFGVIPRSCKIYPPSEVLPLNERPVIVVDLPAGVSIDLAHATFRSSNSYVVDADARRLEGVLRFWWFWPAKPE